MAASIAIVALLIVSSSLALQQSLTVNCGNTKGMAIGTVGPFSGVDYFDVRPVKRMKPTPATATCTFSVPNADLPLPGAIVTVDLWTDHKGFDSRGGVKDWIKLLTGTTTIASLIPNSDGVFQDDSIRLPSASITAVVTWGGLIPTAQMPTLVIRLTTSAEFIHIAKVATLSTGCQNRTSCPPTKG